MTDQKTLKISSDTLPHTSSRIWRRGFFIIFPALALFRLLVLLSNPLDLSPDETYYWEWSKKLDWSYYSKGPLIALLIRAGTAIWGDHAWAVRMPAFFCSLLFSLVFFFTAERISNTKAAFLAWLALQTTLMFSSSWLLITTDAPVALFWAISLACALRAISLDKPWWWFPALAAMGLGILAKYTAVLLALGYFVYLLLDSKRRQHLQTLGWWSGVLAALLCILPILFWNIDHSWVNLQHNAGHLSNNQGLRFNPIYLLELIGGQLGLIGPVLFVALCLVVYIGWNLWRTSGDQVLGMLLWTAFPLIALCLTVSLTRRIYANWPMPLYIGALLISARLSQFSKPHPMINRKWIVSSLATSALVTLIAHLPLYGFNLGIPAKMLTTKKLVGWEELGNRVQINMNTLKAQGTPIDYIITNRYDQAAPIAFYAKLPGKVMLGNIDNRRMTQYDIWEGWADLKGKNVLIVLDRKDLPAKVKPHFREINQMPPESSLHITYAGENLRSFYFWYGLSFDGEKLGPKPFSH